MTAPKEPPPPPRRQPQQRQQQDPHHAGDYYSYYEYAHDPLTTPSAQGLMVAWFIGAITVVYVYIWILAPAMTKHSASNTTRTATTSRPPPFASNNNNDKTPIVANGTNGTFLLSPNLVLPVIAWHAPPKDWHVWTAQKLQQYEQECHRLLEDYSRLLETVQGGSSSSDDFSSQRLEERLLQQQWQEDLQRIAHIAQQQQATLAELLQQRPLHYSMALPSTRQLTNSTRSRWPFSSGSNNNKPKNNDTTTLHHPVRLTPTMVVPDYSYDSVAQLMAHLVRDWSDEGDQIRQSLYKWCHDRIPRHARHVLVPGAGLGRLAWELQQPEENRVVHAVELSWSMVGVFAALIGQAPHRWTIYPYLNDIWTNQVTSETRFRAVSIPNVPVMIDSSTGGRISWTIADFVELSLLPQEAAAYDVIVTCFFLDTATNVLEYLRAMERLLLPGGQWINVGPLHWHANARIVLTAEQLRALLLQASWNIVEWSIDTQPLEYRSVTTTSANGQATSTRYEAYRPLRFVVEKKGR